MTPPNPVLNLLLSLSRTVAVQCLIALHEIGPLPVTQAAVIEATGESPEDIKRGLNRLKRVGLATCSDGKHQTGWQLTPLAQQLPLPLALLDQYAGLTPVQPEYASAPLHAEQPGHAALIEQANGAHARLQAGNAAAPNMPKRGIDSAGSAESNDRLLILLNESSPQIIESNNKNTDTPIPKNRQSKLAQRDARHISQILRALKVRGLPVLDDADPFPPDLRLCINALVKLSCPRKRAEVAIARSSWDSATILKEIARWKAHKQSPAGASITDSGFPFLVAARLEGAEPCPTYAFDETDIETPADQPAPPESNPALPEEPSPDLEHPEPVEGQGPPIVYGHTVTPADAEHWQQALASLRLEMQLATFEAWLRDTWIERIEGDTYHIGVWNIHARDWLTNRLTATVARTLKTILGHPVTVLFVVTAIALPVAAIAPPVAGTLVIDQDDSTVRV